jgi:hypothetical protein
MELATKSTKSTKYLPRISRSKHEVFLDTSVTFCFRKIQHEGFAEDTKPLAKSRLQARQSSQRNNFLDVDCADYAGSKELFDTGLHRINTVKKRKFIFLNYR